MHVAAETVTPEFAFTGQAASENKVGLDYLALMYTRVGTKSGTWAYRHIHHGRTAPGVLRAEKRRSLYSAMKIE